MPQRHTTSLGFVLTVCGLVLLTTSDGVSAADRDLRLIDAAKRSDVNAVRLLLKQGVDVNARQADGGTALLWASYYHEKNLVALLLAAGADVNAANLYGETPLSLACEKGGAMLVNDLLAAGADATATKPSGETTVMTAARSGDVAIVKALLAYGGPLNASEPAEHQTALMWAAAHRHPDIVGALIDAGADVHAKSKRGSTALHFAVQQSDVASAKRLLAAGADVKARMTVRQIDGFTLGLVETLDDLTPLLLAITVCRQDGPEFNGSTVPHPLGQSCPASEEIAALFLDRGADPNDTDGSRIPTLHQAVHAGMPNLVKALISHGADINARVPASVRQWTGPNRNGARAISPTPVGATPLFIAAWWHRPEIMETLIAAGADASIAATNNITPLMAAAGVAGRPPMGFSQRIDVPQMLEAVKLAMARGNDVNGVDEAGQTAMHGAARLGSIELIQLLADRGGTVDVVDKSGRTPLELARTTRSSDYAEVNKAAVDLLTKLSVKRESAR